MDHVNENKPSMTRKSWESEIEEWVRDAEIWMDRPISFNSNDRAFSLCAVLRSVGFPVLPSSFVHALSPPPASRTLGYKCEWLHTGCSKRRRRCLQIYIYIHTKQWICILPDRGYLACNRSGKLLVQYRTIFSRFYTEHAIKTHSNVFYIAPKKGFHYGCNSFWGLYSSLYYGSLFNFVENGSIKNLSQSNI